MSQNEVFRALAVAMVATLAWAWLDMWEVRTLARGMFAEVRAEIALAEALNRRHDLTRCRITNAAPIHSRADSTFVLAVCP